MNPPYPLVVPLDRKALRAFGVKMPFVGGANLTVNGADAGGDERRD
jgi:hypothetical protein